MRLRVALSWLLRFTWSYRASSGGERSLHDPEAKARALGAQVITAGTMVELRTVAMAAEQVLPRLTAPVLYLQSREDNRVTVHDAERHFAMIGSAEKVQRWMTGSGHIISADYSKDEVAAQVIEWFEAHNPVGTPRSDG